MVPVNLGFSQPKKNLQKLSAIWAQTLKSVCQSRSRPNHFKEYRFQGREIPSLPLGLI